MTAANRSIHCSQIPVISTDIERPWKRWRKAEVNSGFRIRFSLTHHLIIRELCFKEDNCIWGPFLFLFFFAFYIANYLSFYIIFHQSQCSCLAMNSILLFYSILFITGVKLFTTFSKHNLCFYWQFIENSILRLFLSQTDANSIQLGLRCKVFYLFYLFKEFYFYTLFLNNAILCHFPPSLVWNQFNSA